MEGWLECQVAREADKNRFRVIVTDVDNIDTAMDVAKSDVHLTITAEDAALLRAGLPLPALVRVQGLYRVTQDGQPYVMAMLPEPKGRQRVVVVAADRLTGIDAAQLSSAAWLDDGPDDEDEADEDEEGEDDEEGYFDPNAECQFTFVIHGNPDGTLDHAFCTLHRDFEELDGALAVPETLSVFYDEDGRAVGFAMRKPLELAELLAHVQPDDVAAVTTFLTQAAPEWLVIR